MIYMNYKLLGVLILFPQLHYIEQLIPALRSKVHVSFNDLHRNSTEFMAHSYMHPIQIYTVRAKNKMHLSYKNNHCRNRHQK
jgi:hypothetical protein